MTLTVTVNAHPGARAKVLHKKGHAYEVEDIVIQSREEYNIYDPEGFLEVREVDEFVPRVPE